METFKLIEDTEALARLKNWLVMNLKFTLQEIEEKICRFKVIHGEERLLDLAYYLQYACISQISYTLIVETVYNDLCNEEKKFALKSFCYSNLYKSKALLQKLNVRRQNVK